MSRLESITDKVIQSFVTGMLALIVIISMIALFDGNNSNEAPIGSFDTMDFNEGWLIDDNSESRQVTLPTRADASSGDLIRLTNTLPTGLHNGTNLMTRASMADIYIYINGELRTEYSSDSLGIKTFHNPSAYVVTELSTRDSGAPIEIVARTKAVGNISEVQIGPGNNVWFGVITGSLLKTVVASVVLVIGVILVFLYFGLKKITSSSRAPLNLGLLMIDMSIWVFSESLLRQLIFSRPSLSRYFAYFTIEIIGILACRYFNEVQHKKYYRRYLIVEILASVQLLINFILHFSGISELYNTLKFSHLWMFVALLVALFNLVEDIYRKEIKQYGVIAYGIWSFIVLSSFELLGFYISRYFVSGIFICLGLVALTVTTLIQVLIDQIQESKNKEAKQTGMMINTIKTIAGAIDAKDEYTGDHSSRVGDYAALLAREMASEYDLSESDIQRIQYIGIMHDIGKIGVADPVLNKVGRLTDSEFTLMKRHVEIGAALMTGIGDGIDGLIDGILYHHERYDGRGYPLGLSGEDIPLIARILCLADCYDAMTSNRIYRRRLTDEEVREEFVKNGGKQFDPRLTELFVALMDRGELKPYTIEGMATTDTGEILKSARLEEYLQKMAASLSADRKNPTHIRMLCYLMKIKEKNGEKIDVYILRSLDTDGDGIEEKISTNEYIDKLIKGYIGPQDVMVEYNDYIRIIAFFGKDDKDIESFINSMKENENTIACEKF